MLNNIFLKISPLLGLIVFLSCNGSKENNNNTDSDTSSHEVKAELVSTKLEIKTLPDNKKEFKIGATSKISVKQIDTVSFDSIQLYFDKEYIKTVASLPFEFEVKQINEKCGKTNFEAHIYKNGTNITQSLSLTFLSDIEPKKYTYEVVRVYPHDKEAFTQGLVFENGFFYEATGLKGASSIRKVQVGTGDIIQSFSVSSDYFGEGITIFGDKIIQLSWRENVGFVYNKNTFQMLEKFNYPTEGWGLTNDGKYLIMSDGTNKLYFLDNQSYTEINRIEVYDNESPVPSLNELEYINGEVYANIYQTDNIARIDPKSGKVLSYIDLTGILPKKDYVRGETDVLNGIAYDFENNKLFVTGKKWPKLFEINLKPKK